MNKRIKSFLLLIVFMSSFNYGMDFGSSPSIVSFKSFLKEQKTLILFLCGIGSSGYILYKLHRLYKTYRGNSSQEPETNAHGKQLLLFPILSNELIGDRRYIRSLEKDEESVEARDIWQMLAGNYLLYNYLFQDDSAKSEHRYFFLPLDVKNRLAFFIMQLENYFYNSAQDSFVQKLLRCTIFLRNDSKATALPADGKWTHDAKYCVTPDSIYTENGEKIKSFDMSRESILFKNKNLVLLYVQYQNQHQGGCSLYDIENDKDYFLMSSSRNSIKISSDENYLLGRNDESIFLWNITDIEKITRVGAEYQRPYDIALSEDNNFIVASSYENGVHAFLWKVSNGELKKVQSYPVETWSNVRFVGDNLMITSQYGRHASSYCLNLNIVEYENGKVDLIEVFRLENCAACWDCHSSSHHIHDKIFIYQDKTFKKLKMATFSGDILYEEDGELWRATWSEDLCYLSALYSQRKNEDRNKIFCFKTDSDDKISISQKTIKYMPGCWTRINKQSTLMLQDAQGNNAQRNHALCLYNLNGNLIKAWNGLKENNVMAFHPNGRELFISFITCPGSHRQCKNVKWTLYPENADGHLRKMVSNMNMAQYYALKTITSKAEAGIEQSGKLIQETSQLFFM